MDNILNRITPIYSADLRNEATKKYDLEVFIIISHVFINNGVQIEYSRFLFGDSAPLFALIGVCLASGTGILTKDDELEGVCWEIRVSISCVPSIQISNFSFFYFSN